MLALDGLRPLFELLDLLLEVLLQLLLRFEVSLQRRDAAAKVLGRLSRVGSRIARLVRHCDGLGHRGALFGATPSGREGDTDGHFVSHLAFYLALFSDASSQRER